MARVGVGDAVAVGGTVAVAGGSGAAACRATWTAAAIPAIVGVATTFGGRVAAAVAASNNPTCTAINRPSHHRPGQRIG